MGEKNIKIYDEGKEEFDLYALRGYKVVKSNFFVQRARFNLSVKQLKIVYYIISKIKPGEEDFSYQRFNIKEFMAVCGIKDSGKNYIDVKKAIKKLADESSWVMLDDNTEVLVRWIDKAWINKASGIIHIRLDNDLKPYLLNLGRLFTQYLLYYILPMRSQYSIRLYELLKSYSNKRKIEFNLEELKRLLSAENYSGYKYFKRNVLEIALREINDLTDLNISYKTIKEGRNIVKIVFYMGIKWRLEDKIRINHRVTEVIGPNS